MTDHLTEEGLLLVNDTPYSSSGIETGEMKFTDQADRIQLCGNGLFGAEPNDTGDRQRIFNDNENGKLLCVLAVSGKIIRNMYDWNQADVLNSSLF